MVACELSRRHPPENLRCPRCDSSDTKFCYYNNYNTSQPRHFCKSCKRYWTAGGSLRNVPVGGGLRKNKRSKLLNQVKDMVVSSSSDDRFQGNSLAGNPPYAFAQDGLLYEAPRPLSFAPPSYGVSPSSCTNVGSSDGSMANPYAFRSLNPVDYGYFGENRGDDFGTAGMDPSFLNSTTVRQQAQFHSDYGRALPEGVHPHLNGVTLGAHNLTGALQANSLCRIAPETPSETSHASSDVNDAHNAFSVPNLHGFSSAKGHMHGEEVERISREEAADASALTRQESVFAEKALKQESLTPSEELRHVEDNQLRDASSAEGEEEDLGNVVNVRYPYDWEQVSEVLFGGTPDFFQLSG